MIKNIAVNIGAGLFQLLVTSFDIVRMPIAVIIGVILGWHKLSIQALSYPLKCLMFDLYLTIGILYRPCRDYQRLLCVFRILTPILDTCYDRLEIPDEATNAVMWLYIA